MRRLLLFLVFAALLAVPAAGADGDRLAAAFLKTASVPSASFVLAGSVTAQGQAVPFRAAGAFDTAAGSARLAFRIANPGGPGSITFSMIVDGKTGALYVRFPLLARLAGTKKPWLKLDLGKAASGGARALGPLLQADPAVELGLACALRGTRRVGAADVRGVPTTHYRALIDSMQAARCAPPSVRRGLGGLGKQLQGVPGLPVDAYVDAQGFVRRLAVGVAARAGKTPLRAALTIDLSGFGQPLNVTPPPPSQVATPKNLKLDLGGILGGD
jgi:hypothetical protein